MKNIAKCDTWCELQNPVNHRGVVLARKVLHGLQTLERDKDEYIRVEFDPGGRELVSSVGQIKSFTRSE